MLHSKEHLARTREILDTITARQGDVRDTKFIREIQIDELQGLIRANLEKTLAMNIHQFLIDTPYRGPSITHEYIFLRIKALVDQVMLGDKRVKDWNFHVANGVCLISVNEYRIGNDRNR